MKLKGMRDIPTRYGLVHRAVSKTRAQVMAELAYLEHEATRLERELKIWTGNAKQTESRLRLILQRIGLLQGLLEERAPAPRNVPPPGDDEGKQDQEQEQVPSWREIPLEY